jgi:hypothetical protein
MAALNAERDAEAKKIRDELGLSDSLEDALDWCKNHGYTVDISYDGYTTDWEEDRWDSNSSYGHYTVSKSRYHEPFEYSVDPEDALDFVWDHIIADDEKYLTPAYLDKAIKDRLAKLPKWQSNRAPEIKADAQKLLSEYNKVNDFYERYDDYDDYDLFLTFIVDRLEYFAGYYEPLFLEYYSDRAHNNY